VASEAYSIIINGDDFSDCIGMDSYSWQISSFSAQTETGQDVSGAFHVPVLGERIQLAFEAPEALPKQRLYELAEALSFGKNGQRECTVNYNDPAYDMLSQTYYCTNLPWIKQRLPSGDYVKGLTWQLTSTTFINASIAQGAPSSNPDYPEGGSYRFFLGSEDFSDIISIDDGFKQSLIAQSLQSETGLLLSGDFLIPIIGERNGMEIKCTTVVEVPRFRMLCAALNFGKTGERSHECRWFDEARGEMQTQIFYCTSLKGTRKALPSGDYMMDVSFQQAMKQFY
jgi:hypothetical protein